MSFSVGILVTQDPDMVDPPDTFALQKELPNLIESSESPLEETTAGNEDTRTFITILR